MWRNVATNKRQCKLHNDKLLLKHWVRSKTAKLLSVAIKNYWQAPGSLFRTRMLLTRKIYTNVDECLVEKGKWKKSVNPKNKLKIRTRIETFVFALMFATKCCWEYYKGSCNFENFQNITRAHKSWIVLALIRTIFYTLYLSLGSFVPIRHQRMFNGERRMSTDMSQFSWKILMWMLWWLYWQWYTLWR